MGDGGFRGRGYEVMRGFFLDFGLGVRVVRGLGVVRRGRGMLLYIRIMCDTKND